jgi:DedD protein
MKLVIDEKLKHRLIGLAVIISLAAIFAPAIMKKSSQNMENNYSVSVKLPTKPIEPNVAISDEKEVFKTIKIAKVSIPDVSSESQLPKLAKAEILHSDAIAEKDISTIGASSLESVQLAVNQASKNTVQHASASSVIHNRPVISRPLAVAKVTLKRQVNPVKIAARPSTRKPAIRAEVYAVQLASFARLANAQALVNKLQSKGYKASYAKIANRQGVVYKVYAGHSARKTEVIKLKTQLASAMQLNGFIVNTGVS